MPQVIAGTGSDLPKTIAKLVKELLENNWPTSAYDPLKSEIGFGLGSWDSYGDIDIHVTPDTGASEPSEVSGGYSKITDPVLIKLWVRKNTEEIPDSVGSAQRKIEEIIKDNLRTLGHGITMIIFNGWDEILEDENLQDVWLATGRASAIFWRATI